MPPPELPSRPSDDSGAGTTPAVEAFCEFLRRCDADPSTSFDDFCRLRPEVAEDLRTLHARWSELQPVYERLRAGENLSQRLRSTYGDSVDPQISLGGGGDGSATDASARILRRLDRNGGAGKRYVYTELVARGGMGAILKVWDEDLRRNLAMKVALRHDEDVADQGTPKIEENQLSRFLEEAQITGQLDHPGILPVHEMGIDANGRVYFTMPLVKGRNLKDIFDCVREGRDGWTVRRALGILIKVCEAMAFAHSKGVLHRDLKPANIMVGRFGETYVMDWGLAKVIGRQRAHDTRERAKVGSSMSLVRTDRREEASCDPDSPLVTLDGDVVGTPAYMAPEQARGSHEDLGPQADVYAVGSMLYHLLAGRIPYEQEGVRMSPHTVLNRVIDGPPPPVEEVNPSIDAELAAICAKAMERDPDQRYPGMLELAEDLRNFLEGHVVHAYEQGAWAEFRKWVTRNRGFASVLAACVVLAFGAVTAVALIETGNREDLADANQSLETANREMAAARDEAREAARLEGLARRRADEAADKASRQSYVANLRAADYSLRLYRAGVAKRRLAACEEGLREWEWHHLALKADPQDGLLRHEGAVTSLDLTPDGTQLLSSAADGSLRLWDLASGEVVSVFSDAEVPTANNAAALSPDGATIVSASNSPMLWVWDVASGEMVRSVRGHTSWQILSVAYDPGGGRYASVGADRTVMLWDAGSHERLATLSEGGQASEAAFRPGTGELAVAHEDQRVRVWGADGVELVLALEAPGGAATCVTYSGDGARLVAGSADGTARVWRASTGELVAVLRGHARGVRDAAFSPDGARIVTGSDDDTVRVWSAASGELLEVLQGPVASVRAVAFTADGAAVVAGSDDGTIRTWTLGSSPTCTRLDGHADAILGLALSPDGKQLASASADGRVRLWNVRTGRAVTTLEQHQKKASAVAFTPDGERLVTGSWDATVRVFDARTARPLQVLTGHAKRVHCVAVSPDGAVYASGDSNGQIRIWDAARGESVSILEGHAEAVTGLAFGPDGRVLVSASLDESVKLWDTATNDVVELSGHTQNVNAVAISPDGRLVASGSSDDSVRVWSADSGALVHVLEGHENVVHSVAFSPDGSRILSGSADATARIWDVQLGEELLAIENDVPLRCVAFGPLGRVIAAAEENRPGAPSRIWVWHSAPRS